MLVLEFEMVVFKSSGITSISDLLVTGASGNGTTSEHSGLGEPYRLCDTSVEAARTLYQHWRSRISTSSYLEYTNQISSLLGCSQPQLAFS